MKKIIILLAVMLSVFVAKAEDILQATPFTTTAGITSDEAKYFSIEMNNSSAEIWALEFEMVLPSGMTLDSTGGLNPFELVAERCPYKVGRGGAITWNHQVICTEISENKYYITVTTVEADRFKGNTGELLRAYYLTDENMQPGIYPIQIKGTVMAIDGNDDIKPIESSSYVVIGDSPLKTEAIPDLSSLTGYIPSWVVSSINNEIAQNTSLIGLNLSGVKSLGGSLSPLNKNALFYVSAEADMTDKYDCGSVVYIGDTYKCEMLNLYSGDYNFYASQIIQGVKANYDLNLEGGVYTTLCLPFALPQEQVSILKEKGVVIEKLTEYNKDKNELTFTEVSETEANVPYLVKCNSSIAPFVELMINEIAASDNMVNVTVGDVNMQGVLYSTDFVSNDTETYYVYDGNSDKFVKVESETKISPFNALIRMNTDQSKSELSIYHCNDDVVAVKSITDDLLHTVDVYTVLGHKVRSNVNMENATEGLDCGVYIIGNKKVLVK